MTVGLAIGGVLLPFVCHIVSLQGIPKPSWQSGNLYDQLVFALSARNGFMLYPFMLYAIGCMLALLAYEAELAGHVVVRCGVMAGVIVAAWYCVIVGVVILEIKAGLGAQWLGLAALWLMASLSPFAGYGLLRSGLALRRRLGLPWPMLCLTGLGLYLIGAAVSNVALSDVALLPIRGFFVALVGTAFLGVVLAPFLTFTAYLAMTVRLLRWYPQARRFRMSDLLIGLTGLAGFLGACRWSVLRSLAEYSELPTSPPPACYVATAAARGHTWLVGSHEIVSPCGTHWRLNRQLRILKAAEIAIATMAPHLHGYVRQVYNRLGPVAARYLIHPLAADAAYLLLKPAELLATVGLRGLLGAHFREIERLYGASAPNRERDAEET